MLESKVEGVKFGRRASACLPRPRRCSSYTVGCMRSDWLRGWEDFLHLSGWQAARHASPDCCISQSVRPQFLASKCLDKHHRNNKKIYWCQSAHKMVVFFLPQCCWQLSLLLGSGIIRSFCFWSKSAKTARLHGWGKGEKKHWTHGFW